MLIFWQHLGFDVGDAKRRSHRLRRFAIVPREHDDTVVACSQARERCRCRGLDRIGDRQDAGRASVERHVDDRRPRTAVLRGAVLEALRHVRDESRAAARR